VVVWEGGEEPTIVLGNSGLAAFHCSDAVDGIVIVPPKTVDEEALWTLHPSRCGSIRLGSYVHRLAVEAVSVCRIGTALSKLNAVEVVAIVLPEAVQHAVVRTGRPSLSIKAYPPVLVPAGSVSNRTTVSLFNYPQSTPDVFPQA